MIEELSSSTFFTIHVGLESDEPNLSVTGNRERLFAILNERHSHGYTAIEGIGSFAGRQEPCVLVTVAYVGEGVGSQAAFTYVQDTARRIRQALGQHEVWISKRTEGLRIV